MSSIRRVREGSVRRGRAPRFVAAAAAIVLAVMGVGAAASASAAEPFATQGTVDSIDFGTTVTQTGWLTELTGTWSIADNPTSPAGFSLDLPAGLAVADMTFPISTPGGAPMGSCTTSTDPATSLGRMVCELDPAYIAAHPTKLNGSFDLWVNVTTTVTETTDVTYHFGDVDATVTIQPPTPGGPCTTDCDFTGLYEYKSGYWDNNYQRLDWTVGVGAPKTGMVGGQTVEVTDTLGPNQAYDVAPVVFKTNKTSVNGSGQEVLSDWQQLPTTDYTVTGGGSVVTFTAEAGYFYVIHYYSKPTDGNAQKVYTNEAQIKVGTETHTPVTSQVEAKGGSATGVGQGVGRFSVTKAIVGDVTGLEDVAFTVKYTVTPTTGDPTTGSFTVKAGETWTSGDFPKDSTVHLEEVVPTDPVGIAWTPKFSQNDFVMAGGSLTGVQLENTAALKLGAFSIEKTIDGTGANQVPADATFTVDYSYPAGAGYAAGKGTLTLKAGVAQTVSGLPVGAAVSFTEGTPAAVDGASWTGAVFTPKTVVIGDGDAVSVALKNTITTVPPTTTPPTTTPPTSPLASTGTELPLIAGGVAVAFLIAGAALAAIRTRRS